MSKRYSRRHRKAHRKAHRKSHRKAHRKSHRRHSRRQFGGANCAAMPFNSQLLGSQRGGMAPISNDGYLLDAATRVQAQVAPLDQAFAQLPSVIPKQAGGGRRSRGRRATRRRHQRGGMQDFDAAYTYNPSYQGQNPQWQSVTNAGAQAPGQINYV